MDSKLLLERALKKEFLTAEEGQFLYENVPTADLMWTANELRQMQVPGNVVTWQIDRNVNTTNACTANLLAKYTSEAKKIANPKKKRSPLSKYKYSKIKTKLPIISPKSLGVNDLILGPVPSMLNVAGVNI